VQLNVLVHVIKHWSPSADQTANQRQQTRHLWHIGLRNWGLLEGCHAPAPSQCILWMLELRRLRNHTRKALFKSQNAPAEIGSLVLFYRRHSYWNWHLCTEVDRTFYMYRKWLYRYWHSMYRNWRYGKTCTKSVCAETVLYWKWRTPLMYRLLWGKNKLRFACVGKMRIFIRSNIRILHI